MSDNELDRTLVHPEQTHDSVLPAVDSSISTIIPSQPLYQKSSQSHHHQPNHHCLNPESAHYLRCDGAVETTTITGTVSANSQHQHLIRYQNPFARHLHSTINNDEPKRVSTSLPLYLTKVSVLDVFEVLDDDNRHQRSDLCTLVPRPGMEYVPLRTPAAEPYHYHHVTDQTKSLQELQNEVGALLEFRDLVIETFPDLKSKMASSAANSTLTGIPSSSSSLAIRREWEPGIRVRRKLTPKETGSGSIASGGGGASSSTTIIPGGGSISSNGNNGSGSHSASAATSTIGANVAGGNSGSSIVSNATPTNTTTDLNLPNQQQQQQQQQQQAPQQHSHPHHHHHHHHTHAQHGSNSSSGGSNHPHQQQQHSSSSLIRSRSNSHSGKKEPKSGEGNNGSVIQDSGFSTETSSSKETHSAASSTSGTVQGALILSTTINRLGVETEDELWNLLDVIHRKGSRLREEVDQHLEREKNRATNLAINHPHHHAHHHPHYAVAVPTSTAGAVSVGAHHLPQLQHMPDSGEAVSTGTSTTTTTTTPTMGLARSNVGSTSSNSSSSSGNNITIHHSNPALVTNVAAVGHAPASQASASAARSAVTTTTLIVSSAAATPGGGTGTLTKSFHSQLVGHSSSVASGAAAAVLVAPKDHNVQILRNERDRLLDKLSESEAETFAGRIREAKMHDELETLTLTMRDLQEQLKVAHSQKLELNSKLHDLVLQSVNRSAPNSPESIKARQQQAPPITGVSQQAQQMSSTPSQLLKPASRYHHAPHHPSSAGGVSNKSPAAPPVPSPDNVIFAEADAGAHTTGSPTVEPIDGALAGATSSTMRVVEPKMYGLGRLDTLLGSSQLQKVRSIDSKKFAAILLETNIVELQRHLLTVTVQNQILQQRVEQATRSRLFLSEKFEKSKEDLDDLRFQLMEKSIELEGTKAQLRVIESKSTNGKSASPSVETSPEHVARRPVAVPQQHASHLMQHHLHHHHQGVPSVAANSLLAMRLSSSQVSTPSMKAMTPVAMDDMIAQHQQHSSSTESAQDQVERDSLGGRLQQQQQQCQAPETPRRRPSKIPLLGSAKGSAAPKPPSGRNFSATPTPTTPTGPAVMQRTLGSSGPSSNRSLTKSTGSLYVKSSDAVSFSAQAPGSSWRNSSSSNNSTSKDTPSLEKSRSSSIPISTPKGAISPPQTERVIQMAGTRATPAMMMLPPPPIPPAASYGGIVSSSPLPRAKRDTLTTKVKNCDSLSRKKSVRKDATSASIGSGQSVSSAGSAAAPAVRERKSSAGGGLRHASNSSLGFGSQADSTTMTTSGLQQQQPAGTISSSSNNSATTSDNGKARRSNTFRLTKPTLSPLLLLGTGPPAGPTFGSSSPLPGIIIATVPSTTVLTLSADAPDASTSRSAGFSLRKCSTNSNGSSGTARTRSQTATDGPMTIVSIVRSAYSTSSVPSATGGSRRNKRAQEEGSAGERITRNLIGEYLAAKKSRCATQQQRQQLLPIPPPIFHVHQSLSNHHHQGQEQQHHQRQIDELAYKHPVLLIGDENERFNDEDDDDDGEGYIDRRPAKSDDDGSSIELVLQENSNAQSRHEIEDDDQTSAANESLIVPRPKMIAFHSLKGSKEQLQHQQHQRQGLPSSPLSSTCRLVGKVNPNILKTWEQLSGVTVRQNSCVHHQQQIRSASTGRIFPLAERCFGNGELSDAPVRPLLTAASNTRNLLFDETDRLADTSDSGESGNDRQSCLLYCPQPRPYEQLGQEGDKEEEEEEVIEFKVNKLQHPTAVTSVKTRTNSSGTGATTTNAGSTSSDGIDFYDSIDAISTCVRKPGPSRLPATLIPAYATDTEFIDDEKSAVSYSDLMSGDAGEALAELTSLDQKRLLWSIDITE